MLCPLTRTFINGPWPAAKVALARMVNLWLLLCTKRSAPFQSMSSRPRTTSMPSTSPLS